MVINLILNVHPYPQRAKKLNAKSNNEVPQMLNTQRMKKMVRIIKQA